jgi:peptidoglycan/LPS O-acetylase OafA/YrhL
LGEERTKTPSRLAYQPALDGLRAFAVLGVMAYHLSTFGRVSGGFLGVDVFFVLSGFLITSLLVIERQRTDRIGFPSFWARRARRLLPALLILLLAIAFYARFIAPATAHVAIRQQVLSTLFYFQNWWLAYHPAFTDLSHTWSLSIEEQFYLVWPLVVGFVLWRTRTNLRAMFTVCVVGACASALLMIVLTPSAAHFNRAYMGTDTRAQELLVGAALAVFMLWKPRAPSRRRARVLDVAGLACAAFIGVLFLRARTSDAWLYHGGLVLVALAVAVIIAASMEPEGVVVRRVLALPPLVAIGLVSYGLYLYHVPIFLWISEANVGIRGIPLALLRLAVVGVVAFLSYRLVEMPVRRGALTRPPAQLAAAAVAAVAVLALVLPGVQATSATPTADAAQLPASLQRQLRTYSRTTPRGAVKVLAIGDTSAYSLGQASGGPFDVDGIRGVTYGVPGCGISDGRAVVDKALLAARPECAQWEARFQAAVSSYRPDVAMLLLGADERFDRWLGGSVAVVGSAELERSLTANLDAARQALTSGGAALVLATVPCVLLGHQDLTGVAELAAEPHRVAWLNGVVLRYAQTHPGVRVTELPDTFCREPEPVAAVDPQPLRSTATELTPAQARSVWQALAPVARLAAAPR